MQELRDYVLGLSQGGLLPRLRHACGHRLMIFRRLLTDFTGTNRTGGHVLATQTFSADPAALGPIRDFVQKWAKEVGVAEDQIHRIKLAACEACANAIEHPAEHGDITLWAWHQLDRFTVDVSHRGEFRIRTGEKEGRRGMGLPLMVASADEVTFTCRPEGGTRVSLTVYVC
jgi:anti-sigma regulatory factor (Ser/Thr protein kinase)